MPSREYSYAGVPPEAVTIIVVFPPKHTMGAAEADTFMAAGAAAITSVFVAVHALASLTVMV
jgi:hypothetical protein